METKEISGVANARTSNKPQFVNAGTNPNVSIPSDAEVLLAKARDEAVKADEAMADHKRTAQVAAEAADQTGWTLIKLMLEVREAFEGDDGTFDEALFSTFLTRNGAARHGNISNPWQRLAKACSPKSNRSLVSKRGYVLSALIQRGVRSNAVVDELAKREPVTPNGPQRTGMERLVLLYRQDAKEKISPEERADPFKNWTDERLMEHALAAMAALQSRGLKLA